MINPTSGNRLLTPPFSLSFLYTIQESGLSGRTARFPAFLEGVPALAGGFLGGIEWTPPLSAGVPWQLGSIAQPGFWRGAHCEGGHAGPPLQGVLLIEMKTLEEGPDLGFRPCAEGSAPIKFVVYQFNFIVKR